MKSINKHEAKSKNRRIKPGIVLAEIITLLIVTCVLVVMTQTGSAGTEALKSTVEVVNADTINLQTFRSHKTLNTSLTALDKRAATEQAKSIERAKKEAEEKEAEEKEAAEKAEQQAQNQTVSANSTASTSVAGATGSSSGSGSATGVLNFAYQYLGYPYVSGGASPSGFCCSGFVWYVYTNAAGKNWSSISVGGLYNEIGGVSVSADEIQPGDIIFFGGLSHVGIYIGGGQIIDAGDESTGVRTTTLNGWVCNWDNIVDIRRVL